MGYKASGVRFGTLYIMGILVVLQESEEPPERRNVGTQMEVLFSSRFRLVDVYCTR